MKKFLKTLLYGFCMAHFKQHGIFRLLKAWQKEFDQLGFVSTIIMDLSKAYEWLPHDLLIAKFEEFSLGMATFSLQKNCLINFEQVGNHKYISQESILGLSLSRIFIDIFLLR